MNASRIALGPPDSRMTSTSSKTARIFYIFLAHQNFVLFCCFVVVTFRQYDILPTNTRTRTGTGSPPGRMHMHTPLSGSKKKKLKRTKQNKKNYAVDETVRYTENVYDAVKTRRASTKQTEEELKGNPT